MTSPGKISEKNVNIDFSASEAIIENQVREHLLAERRARIHEASLSGSQEPGRFSRMIAVLRRRPNPRIASAKPVAPAICSVAFSTKALNGD